jgi:hypothetical protein
MDAKPIASRLKIKPADAGAGVEKDAAGPVAVAGVKELLHRRVGADVEPAEVNSRLSASRGDTSSLITSTMARSFTAVCRLRAHTDMVILPFVKGPVGTEK